MPNNYPEVRGQVTNKIDVLVRANQNGVDLNKPLYAVNWFSTKVAWLYHFYNLLAARSVIKIGGNAFFKAKVTETIVDDHRARRDLILIVYYPGAQNFKALMESTYFKMVSLFRMLAVTKFTFGFTHKVLSDEESKKSDGLHYAIHHFKTAADAKATLDSILNILTDDVSVKYAGQVVANLYSQEKAKEPKQVPNLMDAIIIVQAKTDSALKMLFESVDYQDIIEGLPSNHISLLNRIL